MKSIAKKYLRWGFQARQVSESVSEDQTKQSVAPREMRMDLKRKQIESDLSGTYEDVPGYAKTVMSSFARTLGISQGAFFLAGKKKDKNILRFVAGYAYAKEDTDNLEYEFGEGLTGQVAKDGKMMVIDVVPEGYLTIVSGLGKAEPASVILFPVMHNNKVLAVVELASFSKFLDYDKALIISVMPKIAGTLMELQKKKK